MKVKTDKVAPVYETVQVGTLYAVHRNGRYLMTPGGISIKLPTFPLTHAIMTEWQSQGDKIAPSTMPLTQLACTTLDIVAKNKEKIICGLVAYIDSELLCHRAAASDPLALKQNKHWKPFLDWCNARYDISFTTGNGVMPIRQSKEIAPRLTNALQSLDDFTLAGVSSAVDSSGSLILGLALAEEVSSANDIFFAAELDSTFQAKTWGEDPAMISRQQAVLRDLMACENWFKLLKA